MGFALGIFFSVIYALCVAFDLLFPQMAMYTVWQKLLPGFSWLSLGSFLIGLVETFFYGVLFAILFVPLYNYLGKVFAEKVPVRRAAGPGQPAGGKEAKQMKRMAMVLALLAIGFFPLAASMSQAADPGNRFCMPGSTMMDGGMMSAMMEGGMMGGMMTSAMHQVRPRCGP